jgi:hypothetical protein
MKLLAKMKTKTPRHLLPYCARPNRADHARAWLEGKREENPKNGDITLVPVSPIPTILRKRVVTTV